MPDWISNSSEGTENEQVPNTYILRLLNRKDVTSCAEMGIFYRLAYLIVSLAHFLGGTFVEACGARINPH